MSTSGKKTFSSLESDKENGQVKQVWEITFCSFQFSKKEKKKKNGCFSLGFQLFGAVETKHS